MQTFPPSHLINSSPPSWLESLSLSAMELIDVDLCQADEVAARLETFLSERSQCTAFPQLKADKGRAAWRSLFNVLQDGGAPAASCTAALSCCRLLSRDATHLSENVTEDQVGQLMQLGGLNPADDGQALTVPSSSARLEAKKVLSNLIHQSGVLRTYAIRAGIVPATLHLIAEHSGGAVDAIGGESEEEKKFDFRLLFLVTALCPDQRAEARSQHSALAVLNSALQKAMVPSSGAHGLSPSDREYITELTRALFNISLDTKDEDSAELLAVAVSLDQLLNTATTNMDDIESRMSLYGSVINVVTNFEGRPEVTSAMFGSNMVNVNRTLDFLMYKIEHCSPTSSLKEEVSAVLSVLWNLSRVHPEVRRHLRATVLPPLTAKDIQEKPEKGNSMRNRLVSLLTSADQDVATMTAEFLFVICKHNVGRLVKHTGYGNAAGLLARRGLLRGGRTDEDFSSDEDSETEDYQKEAHRINPIIGCIEEARRNPLEGMSEEQKEFEAMRLVNMIDQLSRGGCIQPCRVGEDGKPEPVEHVLQLQEELARGQEEEEESD